MAIDRLFITAAAAILVTGCASQGGTLQPRPSAEQRQMIEHQEQLRQTEEQEKLARIAREQAALQRYVQSRGKDETAPMAGGKADEQPQIVPLAETTLTERPLDDPMQSRANLNALTAKRSIYYEFDAYNVSEQYETMLTAHSKLLMEDPRLQVSIEGNCDERGSREYNLALGQRRADAVKRALRLLGVSTKQVRAVSFGSEKPKAAGHSETDWAENRRSDLVYAGLDGAKNAKQSSESGR